MLAQITNNSGPTNSIHVAPTSIRHLQTKSPHDQAPYLEDDPVPTARSTTKLMICI